MGSGVRRKRLRLVAHRDLVLEKCKIKRRQNRRFLVQKATIFLLFKIENADCAVSAVRGDDSAGVGDHNTIRVDECANFFD